ncbi:hypothetical protein [Nocardioides humilatus]|uniref:hypothetical protein n=1 Tax=Nocardioides humilatus TaxID=2607660 RepID=UPI00165FFC08|nr:hypothetical protein [Nocardioides humilatus]
MTQLATPETQAPTTGAPGRRTLVGLAGAILVCYVVMLGTGSDVHADTKLADIKGFYDYDQTTSQVMSYVGMVFVALVVFFGAAVRHALRQSRATWLADVSFFGFGALAATFASWVVTDSALWRAVDYGDESSIRSLAAISDAGFLPLMASMIAVYVGTGLVGLTTGAIPKWLAVTSVGIGVVAPMSILGFIGASLLPLWVLALAITVRLEPSA